MTEQPALRPVVSGEVPEWTLGNRMRKAREHAKLSQADLAAKIGIARSSTVNYEASRSKPSRPVLLSWAIITGVSYEWICHGDTCACGPNGRNEKIGMTDMPEVSNSVSRHGVSIFAIPRPVAA